MKSLVLIILRPLNQGGLRTDNRIQVLNTLNLDMAIGNIMFEIKGVKCDTCEISCSAEIAEIPG
jgi:hypothetical protein